MKTSNGSLPAEAALRGFTDLRAGQTISLLSVTGPKGETFAAAFTSEESIAAFVGESMKVGYVGVPSSDFFSMVLGSGNSGAVIDPGGPAPLPLARQMLEALSATEPDPSGAVADVLPEDTQVGIRAPRVRPSPAWMRRLSAALGTHSEVLVMYLVQMKMGEAAPKHVLLLRFHTPPAEPRILEIIGALSQGINDDLGSDETIEVMAIDNADLLELAHQAGIAIT
jgi:hypothetical protein